MSQDAYSPITGRWGVAGIWDVVAIALAVALVAACVLMLAGTAWQRVVALNAAAAPIPAWFGTQWLNDVRVNSPVDGTYCLMDGPVDPGWDCGTEYLSRYFTVMTPLAGLLLALVALLGLVVRGRLHRRALAPA